ncbi:succinylglutamate desuccinylase/aspartoacylase family protein [Nitrosomonas marina]|uniref:succinylglutamate desuccinylase/aspartoacylase family protein n=1 Tax=Nitrosomonas marina TaxID=917 RepID=UPI000B847200|nr:succinylglutamate desuccinylase/aspartoacylase family protein [Nitrosomonas marina]
MQKIIAGSILLLTVLNGFAHQPYTGADHHEPADVDGTAVIVMQPDENNYDEIPDIGIARQPQQLLNILSTEVPPARAMRLSWQPQQSLDGLHLPTPVLVVNGAHTGPAVCLTAAIHGDELNGIEIVRRILHDLNPEQLSGTVIGVPIVNLQGFHRTSRYLPDRRDLNRYFPGNPDGSSAARIAHSFFQEIIQHCHFLVDLHTGSAYRTNMPQIRGNLNVPEVAAFAHLFGIPVILHSEGTEGMLRHAAVNAGIPSVTLEAGKSQTLQESAIRYGVKSILTLLNKLNMIEVDSDPVMLEAVFYQSAWIRVNQGGILFSHVQLGEQVMKNSVLGVVTDPITNARSQIVSPYDGRIIGMAVDQVVMPGFAGFHIGIQQTEEKMSTIGGMLNLPSFPLSGRTPESE